MNERAAKRDSLIYFLGKASKFREYTMLSGCASNTHFPGTVNPGSLVAVVEAIATLPNMRQVDRT